MGKIGTASMPEPQATLVIDGIVHYVPASRLDLEKEIAAGAQLEAELKRLQEQYKTKGATTTVLIDGFKKEIEKLEGELERERAPLKQQITVTAARLEAVKEQVFKLIKPLMGRQKSMKYTGVAGPVQVTRTPKMDVPPASIPILRRLLGDQFGKCFEVTESAKPLAAAWDLLTSLKGKKLQTFNEAVSTTSPGRVRFLAGDE